MSMFPGKPSKIYAFTSIIASRGYLRNYTGKTVFFTVSTEKYCHRQEKCVIIGNKEREQMVKERTASKKPEGKTLSKEATVKKLRLIDFSGDENLTPELIDDALNSTATFYENINLADIAAKIKNNKAKYGGRIP